MAIFSTSRRNKKNKRDSEEREKVLSVTREALSYNVLCIMQPNVMNGSASQNKGATIHCTLFSKALIRSFSFF